MLSLDLGGKRVLIREELNVPIHDGVVSSDARIRAALPTIQAALTARARVLVMSHLGRPEEGKFKSSRISTRLPPRSRLNIFIMFKGAF